MIVLDERAVCIAMLSGWLQSASGVLLCAAVSLPLKGNRLCMAHLVPCFIVLATVQLLFRFVLLASACNLL
jgi:hypothetical protein